MNTSRRQFVRLLGLSAAAGAVAGCESAVDSLAVQLEPASTFSPPESDEIDNVSHILNRLTWGPRPGEYDRVRQMGVGAFIEEQLDPIATSDRRAEWRVNSIESVHQPRGELFNVHPDNLLFDLTRAKLLRGVYSKRQLFEVMVDFWTDHFNIVHDKGQCRWLKVADDRDVIRAHALGNFRDLLRASALSPAMLIYLDGHDNKVRSPRERPNENYARELLELHTLGVHGGYEQQDVIEVARCLSGWTYGHTLLRQDRVSFVAANHDDGEKIVLGHRICAGGGERDLDDVIDIVCRHPSTASHIATKLCRRLIAEEPPIEAIDAVAQRFMECGGDIRQTLRALFATDAFRGPEMRGNLFKRPLRFVISALRATDATTDCGRPLMTALERMGHSPYQYPTPDGYPIESQPWLGTLLWRWNCAITLERGAVNGTRFDPAALRRKAGSLEAVAAFILGRAPKAPELDVLAASEFPHALLLSSPAFQMH